MTGERIDLKGNNPGYTNFGNSRLYDEVDLLSKICLDIWLVKIGNDNSIDNY
jgi:hypothetical protein